MRDKQKVQEKNDLDVFLQLLGIENFEVSYNEKPDFDIKLKDQSIGIELTDYAFSREHSNIIRSVRATMEKVKLDTIRELKNRTDKNLLITYSLRKPLTKKISKIDQKTIANFLLQHLHLPKVQEKLNELFFHLKFKYSKNENLFIESVNVSSGTSIEESLVTDNDTYMFGEIPKAKIETIVSEKNDKMEFHRNNETWLVIVLKEYEFSDGIITENVLRYDMSSYKFDRIFLIEKISLRLYELKKCD